MPSETAKPSVLIVHTRGIGDWIMFTPTLRTLTKVLPGCRVDVLVGTPATAHIVSQYTEISEIHTVDVRAKLSAVLHALLKVRSARYDILIITDGVRAWKARLFALLSRAKSVVLPLASGAGIDNPEDRHRVLRNLRALTKLGMSKPEDIRPYLTNRWSEPAKRSVLIHPGCEGRYSFKRWPADRFLSVATQLANDGFSVTIILGPSELDLEDLFRKGTRGSSIAVLVNTPFVELLQQLALHELCLTSDSGLGHLAAALGRSVVTIFGPANPDLIRPFSGRAVIVRAADESLKCRPCMRVGGRMGCAERPCLTQIDAEQVLKTIRSLPTARAPCGENSRSAEALFDSTEALPEVSVITPARNAGELLLEALNSVAKQVGVRYEHIVVDDGSTDQTPSVLARFAAMDPRVKPIFLEQSRGSIAARNTALKVATGRYVAFLDADDVWLPNKLERQIRFMRRHNVALSYTDYRHMSADGSLVGRLIAGPRAVDWRMHHVSRYIGCLTVMLDRQVLADFHFPTVTPAVRGEDFLAWANVLRSVGKAYRCPGDLARYRLMKSSRSSNKPRAIVSIWRLYRYVENIALPRAVLLWTQFVCSAVIKHVIARPVLSRTLVDAKAALPHK